jgi:ornithine cyclodeaminase/alanine dehydrogenase-like protein (mu-crystallin family)
MSAPIQRLGGEELAAAVAAIDPIDVLAADLVDDDHAEREQGEVLAPWSNSVYATDLVLVSETGHGGGLLMPEPDLRALHTAALAALAARELLAPGRVHCAVLGMGAVVQPLLTMIARRLPAVCRIVVCPATVGRGRAVGVHAVEQIDLAGVELSVTDDLDEAVAGAKLVIVIGGAALELRRDQIGPGALVVNAGGSDLPADLVAAADQRYVDDLARLAGHKERQVTSWRVEADLGQVVSGVHPGRSGPDDIVLAELLDAGALNVRLALCLGRAARERGLSAERID